MAPLIDGKRGDKKIAGDKISVTVDNKGRITIPKEVRERSQIDKGDTLFLGVSPGKIELTRAVEDPLVVLADWSRKEYQAGRTQDLREFAHGDVETFGALSLYHFTACALHTYSFRYAGYPARCIR